jgi:hypothetical protein
MPGTTVPGLGKLIREWRERKGKTRLEWANALFQAGFSGWGEPTSLVWALGTMEDHDEWPFDDGLTAASDFFRAAKTHMTHDALDADAFHELAELLYRPLLTVVQVVMLAPDAPHR